MGGHAFDPERLSTPRMPPEIYHTVKSQLLARLRQHFRHAAVPIEAPAKSDYGDIDILVTDPVEPKSAHKPEYLASLVGAKHWKRGGDAINLAIPWPTTPDSTGSSTLALSAESDPEPKYIQLDVAILRNLQQYKWFIFLHSHGDLWSILGSVLRPYGLLVSPGGFYVHVPEIKGENKNLSRVKVSDDPQEVLRYLGLDEQRYWDERGFGGWDDLLGYLATGRFGILGKRRKREAEEKEKDGRKEEEEASTGADGVVVKDSGGEEELDEEDEGGERVIIPPTSTDSSRKEEENNSLKANDRQRASKRPFFAYYLYTYLPSVLHSSTSISTTTTTPVLDTSASSPATNLTKDEVILDLKSHFGTAFTEHYDQQREKGMRIIGEQKLWSQIRETIKSEGGEGALLGYGMKGVKAMICAEHYAWVEQEGKEKPEAQRDEGWEGSGDPQGREVGEVSATTNETRTVYEDVSTKQRENEAQVQVEGYRKSSFLESKVEVAALRAARLAFQNLRYDEVRRWAEGNWRKAGETQKRIDEDKSKVLMFAKMERDRVKEMEREGARSGDER